MLIDKNNNRHLFLVLFFNSLYLMLLISSAFDLPITLKGNMLYSFIKNTLHYLIHIGRTKQNTFGACADSEGPDQTARMRSLIRVFAVR